MMTTMTMMSKDSMQFPIICHSCGETGSVNRVTANLQCRCGSRDLDLHENGYGDYGKYDDWVHPYWPSADDDETDEDRDQRPSDYRHVRNPAKKNAASGGTGWNQSRPDPAANWDEYAGPRPSHNPLSGQNMDADANHVCPVCNGTGHDQRASGGGYDETTCRNCHGTGRVTYASDSHGGTNDPRVPSGPPLGASDNGRRAKKAKKVVVPSSKGNKKVAVSKSDKLMKMASKILETNTGLSPYEAFVLAERAQAAFSEDGN